MTDARAAARAFAAAYNAGNVEALKALLTVTCQAQVVNAPFPTEIGRDQIATTSLPHILGDPPGALQARAVDVAGESVVVLHDGPLLDTVVRLRVAPADADAGSDAIEAIHYLVTWHALEAMRPFAHAAGLKLEAPRRE